MYSSTLILLLKCEEVVQITCSKAMLAHSQVLVPTQLMSAAAL